MQEALQQVYLLWVPSCRARALLHIPSGSTAGLLRGAEVKSSSTSTVSSTLQTMPHLILPTIPRGRFYLLPFYRQRNTSIKMLKDLHKILPLVSGRTGIHNQG